MIEKARSVNARQNIKERGILTAANLSIGESARGALLLLPVKGDVAAASAGGVRLGVSLTKAGGTLSLRL
jgi:hypothetical protein